MIDALEHGAGGTFAVGACNRDNGEIGIEFQALPDCLNTIQTHGDGLWVLRLDVAKPSGQINR
jgi:hypothetical protein